MIFRTRLGLLSMAAVLCAWLAAPLPLFSQAETPDVLDDPVARGAWLYEGNCTRCHGAYGDQRVGSGKARKELTEQIAGGRAGRCQVDWALTEGGTLSTADIRDLVRYILAWEELGAPPDLPDLPPQPTPTAWPSPTPAQVAADQPTPTPSPTPDPVLATVEPSIAHSPVAEGAWLVHANCAKCHGAYATGRMGQNLPLDQVRDAIVGGKGGTNMPAFALTQGGSLRSRQIDAILAYIAAWESLEESPALPDALVSAMQATRFDQASLQLILPPVIPAASGDPQAGLALYRDHCRTCHGPHGEGHIGGPLARPWPSVRPDLTIRATLAQGITGTLMPAWGDRYGGPLTDAQIDDLVALLVGWSLASADSRDLAGSERPAAAPPSPWRGALGMAGLLLALGGIAGFALVRAGR